MDADDALPALPQPMRSLSRGSCVPVRKTSSRETESAFSDFVSDSDDEDEDDADTRALVRMQQQADDQMFASAPMKMERPPGMISDDNDSFRLTLARPGADNGGAGYVGPKRFASEVAAGDEAAEPELEPNERYQSAADQLAAALAIANSLDSDTAENADDSEEVVPVRKTSCRETESAFADFVSDSDDEDEDDADTRALVRMQQQADDRTYVDTSLKMERPPVANGDNGNDNNSFRLTLARARVVDASGEDCYVGPKRFASGNDELERKSDESDSKQEDERRSSGAVDTCITVCLAEDEDGPSVDVHVKSTDFLNGGDDNAHEGSEPRSSGVDDSFASDTPSFSDVHSFTGATPADNRGDSPYGSLASRPSSFNSDESDSFRDAGKPSFSDAHSFTDQSFTAADDSFVYRPSLLNNNDTARKPMLGNDSVTGRPSSPGEANVTAANHSFVFGPSLSDDNNESDETESDHAVESMETSPAETRTAKMASPVEAKLIEDEENEPSFLSSTLTNFVRTSDVVAVNPSGIDSSFRMQDASSVLRGSGTEPKPPAVDNDQEQAGIENQDAVEISAEDDSSSGDSSDTYAMTRQLDIETTTEAGVGNAVADDQEESLPGERIADTKSPPVAGVCSSSEQNDHLEPTPPANLTNSNPGGENFPEYEEGKDVGVAIDISTLPPSLSRHSSVASTVESHELGSRQRRLTGARESWRVSSLDFLESKHAFDEELGPLTGQPLSPQGSSPEGDVNAYRLTSTFEERGSVESANSNASSFASLSQSNFFVVDMPQGSFSSDRSLSMSSRPSSSDSFANVAILGDDMRDQNERRSSDVITQDIRGSSVAAAFPIAPEALDRSYSDLVDTNLKLDGSFSNLVDRNRADRGSAGTSAYGTSLGSSLASSIMSATSQSSADMPFESFNVTKPQSQGLSAATTTVSDRESESRRVFYGSLVLPTSNEAKPLKTDWSSSVAFDATSFTSAAFLAAIKKRDARTNTRSEETEAGDIAPDALLPLAPPLKINVVPRGRGRGPISGSFTARISGGAQTSSPITGSPLAPPSLIRSSLASSTGTADRLDFTGVYRGSANSLEASRNNGTPAAKEAKTGELKYDQQEALKSQLLFESSAVKLERSTSDSRAIQRESQRKVEEFFRRSYKKFGGVVDERISTRYTNRTTRSRTTVINCVDEIEAEPRQFAFNGDPASKIIDLKNLRTGNKPDADREDITPFSQQLEQISSQPRPMAMTAMTTSSGTTATSFRSGSSEQVLTPSSYLQSPTEAGIHQQQLHDKEKRLSTKAHPSASPGGGFFAVSAGPGDDDVSRFGAVGGHRAENVPLPPTLPRLSASGSSGLSPSGFMVAALTPNGYGGNGGPNMGKSPIPFDTANGFRWKAESGLKQSGADALFDAPCSPVSLSQRPTFANRVQTLSASLASTIHRFLHGKGSTRWATTNGVTSPQSQCTAPSALPRGYDHHGFYLTPFKVPGLNKPTQSQRKQSTTGDSAAWLRQWLTLATCAVLGVSLGAILVRVVIYESSVFNLLADEVHERQDSNGALVFAPGARWLLLPGHLFLRVWQAVSVPLLVCYVATALADLVGCAEKAELVLGLRSLGYALLLAILASLEGVLAMWLSHRFGWFRQSDTSASASATTLSNALGLTPLPEGAVGLVCARESEYLQCLGYDVFACSNASLTLPLFEEVSTNTSGVADSGAGVFGLQEVTSLLATPTQAEPYYPASLGSASQVTISWLSALTPNSVASEATTREMNDEVASLGGLIVIGLLLGYVCGKRILWLRRESQAAMFESVRPSGPTNNPKKTRHYIISVLMELQLALEWLVTALERYLAPVGFFSLMVGNVVLHHREWRSFVSPMASLVVGVLMVVLLHATIILPLVYFQFSSNRQRNRPVVSLTTKSFLPAFLFAFTTDNVGLTAPVSMQCYTRSQTVTRSAAQLVTAVTAALIRNARGLYLPLLLLWLLESSTAETEVLSTSDYIVVGLLSLLSCFIGGSFRLTLAMARTLWSLSVGGSSVLPTTMPLLLVCDVVLSRIANVVSVADHLVLTQLLAQHWDETVVLPRTGEQGVGTVSNVMLSPIQL